MLTDAFSGEYVNRELRSRTYGGYYKPQRLKADSKVTLTSSWTCFLLVTVLSVPLVKVECNKW